MEGMFLESDEQEVVGTFNVVVVSQAGAFDVCRLRLVEQGAVMVHFHENSREAPESEPGVRTIARAVIQSNAGMVISRAGKKRGLHHVSARGCLPPSPNPRDLSIINNSPNIHKGISASGCLVVCLFGISSEISIVPKTKHGSPIEAAWLDLANTK